MTFERILDGLMLLFWVGLGIGLLSAVVPGLGGIAHGIALVAGNGIAFLALGGVLYVVVTSLIPTPRPPAVDPEGTTALP